MTNPCDLKEKADEVLLSLKTIIESCDLDMVLTAGTCLGFIRDGGYIKNDNDIDVGVLSNFQECTPEEKKNLSEKLKHSGFSSGQVMIDGSEHWWAGGGVCMLVCIRWGFAWRLKYMKKFDQVVHNGEVYNVPYPVEDFLSHKYVTATYDNQDYRIPHLRSP